MPPTQTTNVALEGLRQAIRSFAPRHERDERFQSSMLCLADTLERLWEQDGDDTLESNIVWSAVYAFPALTVSGPEAEELVGLTTRGVPPEGDKWNIVIDAETADILESVERIRRALSAFDPPGFAAALWREVLLAIYGMIELFVVIADDRNTDRCFELLDTAEAMADRFAGKS